VIEQSENKQKIKRSCNVTKASSVLLCHTDNTEEIDAMQGKGLLGPNVVPLKLHKSFSLHLNAELTKGLLNASQTTQPYTAPLQGF
jgi:hypothetical protein